MRLTVLTLIGALGFAVASASANAAPLAPPPDARQASGIVQVWGGCGPGFRPVPGHWNRWHGVWIPPHCVPYRPYGPYAAWRPYWGSYRYY
jgi:hypothetical protein